MLGLAAPPEARQATTGADGRLAAARRARDVFAPHRDELRCEPPEDAARLLRALAFAGTHPRLTEGYR